MSIPLPWRTEWRGQAVAWPWRLAKDSQPSNQLFIPFIFVALLALTPACRKADEERSKNGKLVARSQYKEDPDGNHIPHGTYEGWYESGQLRIKGLYVDGKQQGHWECWHANGNPWGSSHYENGELRETTTLWRPDGTIDWQFVYSDGKRDPTYIAYYPSGARKWQGVGNVVRGQWVGTSTWFDERGGEIPAPIGPNGALAWPGDGDFVTPPSTETLSPFENENHQRESPTKQG